MSFSVTNNFVDKYDNGEKKLKAADLDQNFNDVVEATNTLDSTKADDSDVVHLAGNETITGDKTFTGTVDLSGADVISSDNIPVGSIIWSANASVPAGYLLCNGSAVGRSTYPELFTAIGTTFGSGDGSTTFNLPNLINKFIEGGNTAGTEHQAGLPGINGTLMTSVRLNATDSEGVSVTTATGAFAAGENTATRSYFTRTGSTTIKYPFSATFDASRSSSVYGNSSTVQPAAVTALPCIKAFSSVVGDATVVAGQLVNEIQSKVALDGSNTSSIGSTLSTYMAHAAMPSGQYEDLTLPANGGTIEAPSDGWFEFSKYFTAVGQYIALASNSITIKYSASASTDAGYVFLPVKKNAQVTTNYSAGGQTIQFRFVYADGSAPTV